MVEIEKSFHDTLVGDVYEILVQEPVVIRQGTKMRDAIEEMLRNPTSHVVYVVDDDMKLVGAVSTAAVLEMIGYKVGVMGGSTLSFIRFMRDALKDDIGSALRKVTAVRRETRITDALNMMIKNRWDSLPVVDDEGRLVGELVSLELFHKGKDLFE
jgi:CBS domain-containing protein